MREREDPSGNPIREHFDLALLQARAGHRAVQEAEWLRVFRHFNPRLSSFFSDRCDLQYQSEELLTDLWSRACLHVQSLRSSYALWSWLTTIGNNLLTDHQRRRGRSREIAFTDHVEADEQLEQLLAGWIESPEAEPASSELDLLTIAEREFLELYAVDGLSHDEIAGRLGLASAAASRQRLRRLRLRLTDRDDTDND